MTNIRKSKTIDYGDFKAHIFLWQKAITLVPLWAIIAIPIFGFLCRAFGNLPTQLGYGVMIGLLVAYFLEDLLKRKIRMDDEFIYFGYRAIPIDSIVDVDVLYKKGKFLPNSLCITQATGRKLKLSLNGLSSDGAATLLKHIDARNSNLNTSPVLNTLMKCQGAKRKITTKADRFVLAYHSRKIVDESIDVFKSSAHSWARVGPVLLLILTGSFWLNMIAGIFVCLQPHAFAQLENLSMHAFMLQMVEAIRDAIFRGAGRAFESTRLFSQHLAVAMVAASSLLAFVVFVMRALLSPNFIKGDAKGLTLTLTLGELSIPLASVPWKAITNIDLKKAANGPGKISLKRDNGRCTELALEFLSVEDRATLLKHIEKNVPHCQIDHNLTQAMLPKSEMSYTEIWLQSLTQPPERKTLDPLEPGQIIADRFEVLRPIGVGGQGTAYLCRSLMPGAEDYANQNEARHVVLKETIIPAFGSGELRRKSMESFEKEASLLKKLSHSSVVQLIDYFVDDHRAYLVLEHLDGCDLRELVRREGPLSEERVREVAFQMCEILKFLHENSIVHRDFTPDNLIFDSKGRLKVIDFNVAQNMLAKSTGTIVGKHAYLPPEQFRGKATTQSDLYAFGATLFYLLTGKDPEPISQSSPLAAHVRISEELDQIVKNSTALDLKKRFQSIQDIELALQADESLSDSAAVISTNVEAAVTAHGAATAISLKDEIHDEHLEVSH
jgi:serine/threonine protein kinase